MPPKSKDRDRTEYPATRSHVKKDLETKRLRSSRADGSPSLPRKGAVSAGPIRRSDGSTSRPGHPATTGGLRSKSKRYNIGGASGANQSPTFARSIRTLNKGKGRAVETPEDEGGDDSLPIFNPRTSSSSSLNFNNRPFSVSAKSNSERGRRLQKALPPIVFQPNGAPANTYVLNFGQHEGKMLHQIEPDYLRWLVSMRHAKSFASDKYLGLRLALEDYVRRQESRQALTQAEGGSVSQTRVLLKGRLT